MTATMPLHSSALDVMPFSAECRRNLLATHIRVVESVAESLRIDVVELLHQENAYGASRCTG
jgi:hypothetical protein